ncbi:MAG: hypothetical protein HY708_07580 [Ignavibacteriae bacterium]|nr:hypothetical protein [Ignavibacteriota bacterium]
MIQENVVRRVVRFGLPIVILVFYLTASLGFSYTPDSTFLSVQYAKSSGLSSGDMIPSPLWLLFVTTGSVLQLDLVLTAKVFSLFFSCLAILVAYLLAYEVLVDRLLAFCVSLIVAMQSWLLQAAPSGNAIGLGLMLSLTVLFFLLRNEYILAAFTAGLCMMVFWQAVGLMLFLVVDVFINSIDRRHALNTALSATVVFVTALLPWIVFAIWRGVHPIAALVPLNEFPPVSITMSIALGVLVLMMGSGIYFLTSSGGDGRRILTNQIAPALWILWLLVVGISGNEELLFLITPLLVAYAFLGLVQLIRQMRLQSLGYMLPFVITGLLLAQNQLTLISNTSLEMTRSNEHSSELRSIAYWLTANAETSVSVSAERRGIIGYYTDRPIGRFEPGTAPQSDLVVTAARNIDGYELAFRPIREHSELTEHDGHFAVWRKK